jgi:hypothetical protein
MDKITKPMAAAIVVVVAVVAYFIFRSMKSENYIRSTLTQDTSCQFVRSPVDYAFADITPVPERHDWPYPHYLADRTDKLQPLDHGFVDLIKDENKLWQGSDIWKQYENTWAGCGKGYPYVVNDFKTRADLASVGDEGLHRILNGLPSPAHGPAGRNPALSEIDVVVVDPFDKLYGGSDYLPPQIGMDK